MTFAAKIAAPVLAALSLATVAQAEEVVLAAPGAGATLHEGGIDMSVYTRETDDSALELTAIYTPRISAYAPAHLRMALNEGDAVSFGLPGAPGVTYSFARSAQGVTVRADETAVQLASN
ncbi:hypothetical protein DU478_01495 [Thalassococcus profundi]|uniref:Uncharacterized protein n=1 Tax=Thalassococcus profundi TaxID=2282382 RepID=A0A369TSB9_9RHOB|nr:hypothetical protein [Thalassococcus profundi]RDD68171.1 hypothetical protein DU478_01495 [Thalassococcus profundi]